MKKAITGIVLMMAMTVAAQPQPMFASPWSDSCLLVARTLELPYYFCPCRESSQPFAFPLEIEVTDTVWYTATMNDLRQGVSAYWFADCSITMEAFAFCTSKAPTFDLTVGPNQMRDIDMDNINEKLGKLNEQEKLMAETMTPHLRVYPNKKGGSGKVYCYPYDQGPESKCEDPLPLRNGMTYVCDKPENVYRMEWSSIPSQGKAFVHWLQKKNQACEVWLTLDSCSGEEIGRAALSDSLHVFLPDSAQLVDARKGKHSLWLHVKHKQGIVGRIHWYSNPKYNEPLPAVKQKVCLGKTLKSDMRTYESDTTFTDTIWVTKDSLTTREISFTFTQPKMEYDTVYASQTELARGFLYKPSGTVFHTYQDSVVEIKKANTCTRRIHVTVLSTQGMDYVGSSTPKSCKYIRNGQLFILVDDRKYNVFGQEQR